MIKGFAYIAWLVENHPFAEAQAQSPRYIAQEADRLAAQSTIHSPLSTNP
jgi:hypothetical protein